MDVKIWAFCSVLVLISCSFRLGSASNKSTEASTSSLPKTTPLKTNHKTTHGSAVKSTKALPTTTSSTKTTAKPKVSCEARNKSCSICTDDSSCFYCATEKTCKKYDKGKIVPRHCNGNKWYWKQCKVAGSTLIIVIPTVAGVILIMLGCCIYCCCCRRCGKSAARAEESRQRQNRETRQERSDDRKRTRQARHDAIRMKYGLLANQDDDTDPIV